MRALISIALLYIATACGGRPVQPLTYPPFSIPEPNNSTNVSPGALVLIPLSTQAESFSKSAALLSSLCDWIRQTPDVKDRYTSVWLAFNSVQDPVASANLSMQEIMDSINPVKQDVFRDTFRRLRRWLRFEQDSLIDYRELAKEAVTKTFELANHRVDAYACLGDPKASTKDASVLALEQTRIEPYGPGIAYFVVTPNGGRHGYVILNGDSFEKDVARVAALTLSASTEDVIRASISLDIPPEGRCSKDADLPCVYAAFQPKVSVAVAASTFASAKDVEVREWRVEDESGAQGTAIVAPTTSSQEQAALTFTRPGTFRVVAKLATRTEPPLWLERDTRITVRMPSLIIFKDPPILDDRYDIGTTPLHRAELNVSCRTLCQPLTREDVRSVMQKTTRGVVNSQDIERILTEASDAFKGFDLGSWASFEPKWRSAAEAALGYKQVADLVTRTPAAKRDEWCKAVSDLISSSLLKSGIRAPRGLVDSWQTQCEKYASDIKLGVRSIDDTTPSIRHLSGNALVSDSASDLPQDVPIGTEIVVVRASIAGAEDAVPFILYVSTQKLEKFSMAPGGQFLMGSLEGYDGKPYRYRTISPAVEISWRLSFFLYTGEWPPTIRLGDAETTLYPLRFGLAPWCLAMDSYPQLFHTICQRVSLKLLLGTQFEVNAHNLDGPLSRSPTLGIGAGTTIAIPLGRIGINIVGGSSFMFNTRGWVLSGTLGIQYPFWL